MVGESLAGVQILRRVAGAPHRPPEPPAMFLLIFSSWLHGRTSDLHAGVGVRNRDLAVLQWRCGREARDLQDLLFVEGLPLQQSLGQRL
jgi:hypothetical protein